MGFTLAQNNDGETFTAVICDACRGPVGPEGWIIGGERIETDEEEEAPDPVLITSVGDDTTGPPFTVGTACSRDCALVSMALWDMPDFNGQPIPVGISADFYDQPHIQA